MTFPAGKLKTMASSWWDSKTKSPLKPATKTPVKGTVFALQPEMSSQQAVGILVSFKQILGYRPSKNVIKKGGYLNKSEFVGNLLQELQSEFNKKQKGHPPAIQEKGVSINAAISL
ncbi:MAG TPA: hypothetical protein VKX41_15895 [Alloacidobacterium sp.]|nr:hypothetical protein [Alloacidobacterium sp.]